MWNYYNLYLLRAEGILGYCSESPTHFRTIIIFSSKLWSWSYVATVALHVPNTYPLSLEGTKIITGSSSPIFIHMREKHKPLRDNSRINFLFSLLVYSMLTTNFIFFSFACYMFNTTIFGYDRDPQHIRLEGPFSNIQLEGLFYLFSTKAHFIYLAWKPIYPFLTFESSPWVEAHLNNLPRHYQGKAKG